MTLALHQFRYDQKIFWRNPAAVFFTVLFPLMIYVLIAEISGGGRIESLGNIKSSAYFVPAILALAVVAATLVGLAFRLTEARESGQLKRLRGTPLPTPVFVAGRVGNSVVISILMTVVIALVGRAYGVPIPFSTLPALLVTLAIGAAAFSCLGFALAAVIPSEDAAPALTNAFVFPLYFISGIFIPESELPDGVLHVADVFPVRPFFEALFSAYDLGGSGSTLELGHLAVVAAWGVAGLVAALAWFKWEPR